MKKVGILSSMLIFLLVACLVVPVISSSAESNSSKDGETGSQAWIQGDVDQDGKVDIFDASSIQKSIAGTTGYPKYSTMDKTSLEFRVADVDKDGKVDIFDASLIQKFIAGNTEAKTYGIGEPITTVDPTEPTEPVEIPTQAITEPSFLIESVEANAGDKDVAVTVSVVKNPGIAAIALDISYDKTSLQLKNFTYNDAALQGASTTPYNASAKTPCLFMVNGTKNITGDFVFATLYFDVLDSAVGACPITVSYDEDNVYNLAEDNIKFEIVSGAIITPGEKPTEPAPDTCTVTFKDYDGKVLSTQSVEKGSSAVAPAAPSRDGFVFVGWSVSFDNVQSDLTVTVMYQALSDSPSFVIEKVSAAPGQKKVAVTVAVENNPGVAAIALDVIFDSSKLTLTGFTYNETALNGSSTTPFNASASTPCLFMVNGTKDINGDFVFATMYFDVADGASGTCPISVVYDPDNVYNLAEDNVFFDVINGSITVA